MPTDADPSTGRLAAYALPALPLAALTLPLYILVPTFYAETLGLPLAAVGAAFLFVRLFDAVNDPLVGWAADRFRPRFGRRRTLFLLAVPVTALAALQLFWPPPDAGTGWIAFWGALLSLGYTACVIPYYAWGAELSGTYRTRSVITGWRETFTLAGTLAAIALPFAITNAGPHGFHGLALLAVAVAVALPLAAVVAVAAVPEPPERSRARLNLRAGLGHLVANRPFLRLIAAFLVNGLANGIPATLFLYFVSEVIAEPDMRGPLLFLYFAFGLAGVPLATWTARRIGKHRAWALGMLAAMAAFAPAPLLGAGDVTAFAIICAVTGLLVGFDLAIPPAIQADVIDVDTASSGEQRSGAYFAGWSLATKLSLAAAAGLTFPALALIGFDPAPEAINTEGALTGLAVLYAWVPIAFKLGAIALMWNFPVDEEAQLALRKRIETA